MSILIPRLPSHHHFSVHWQAKGAWGEALWRGGSGAWGEALWHGGSFVVTLLQDGVHPATRKNSCADNQFISAAWTGRHWAGWQQHCQFCVVTLCTIHYSHSTSLHTRTLQDVSLAFLLAPLWVATESAQLECGDDPTLVRRLSIRRSKKLSISLGNHPTVCPISEPLGSSFPWQKFRECHSPTHVLLHYHPLCLDNYEYFVGRNTTTLTPRGYRVGVCL